MISLLRTKPLDERYRLIFDNQREGIESGTSESVERPSLRAPIISGWWEILKPFYWLAQVRHGMVEKPPNPFRISSGNSWVYTTFAIELKTLR